jgi:hypothetical protein
MPVVTVVQGTPHLDDLADIGAATLIMLADTAIGVKQRKPIR